MNIEIRTPDPRLASALFGSATPDPPARIILDHGVAITLHSFRRVRGLMEAPVDLLSLTVSVSTGLATGVLANWLWDRLKRTEVHTLSIENTEVDIINKEEIVRIITKKLTVSSNNANHRNSGDS